MTDAAPTMSGNWMLHYRWVTSSYSQVMLTFNGDGRFTGSLSGRWHYHDGTLLLSFDTGPAKYAGSIDGNVGAGAMSTSHGLTGSWYLSKQGTAGVVLTLTAPPGAVDAAGTDVADPSRGGPPKRAETLGEP